MRLFKKRNKRVVSQLFFIFCLCSIFLSVTISVNAADSTNEVTGVDGSCLTYEEYSFGTSSNSMFRGEHLMTGDSIITKTGNGRIYAYGQTTADHDVDFVAVLLYVDRYHEDTERWGQVDAWAKDARDTYYVVTTKTLKVDRGYFYRVHCEHFAGNDDEEMHDSAISFTDGIWIP